MSRPTPRVLFGQILTRDSFRPNIGDEREFVLFPSAEFGLQLFARDRTGTSLRRVRIPRLLNFIDLRRRLMATCEDCAYTLAPLPCNWESLFGLCRNLRGANGLTLTDLEVYRSSGSSSGSVQVLNEIGFGAGGFGTGGYGYGGGVDCPNGDCGLQFLSESDISV